VEHAEAEGVCEDESGRKGAWYLQEENHGRPEFRTELQLLAGGLPGHRPVLIEAKVKVGVGCAPAGAVEAKVEVQVKRRIRATRDT
jgi:hypothetical protein